MKCELHINWGARGVELSIDGRRIPLSAYQARMLARSLEEAASASEREAGMSYVPVMMT